MSARPAALIPMAYGAGLATGLLHFGVPFGALALLVAVSFRQRALLALGAAAYAIGAVGGTIAVRAEQRSCRAVLPAQSMMLRVRLLDPPDGGIVRVLPLAGCAGHIDARWPRGRRDASGSTATVTARWLPRQATGNRAAGVLVITRVDSVSASPVVPERLRTAIVERSRALYGTRAPLVDALVLGSRGGLDAEIRDAFGRSGLVHLLSISGFHVGLISAWVVLVLRALGAPRPRALAAGAVVAAAYVGFLGFPAPATRAAALSALLAIQFARQRNVQANALLACTCLAVLIGDPWAVFDLGGWLSAAALWGATTATRWSDTAFGEGFLIRTLASSVGATLATAPITAAALGTVAMAGIVLNVLAIPIAALAVPGVVASLLLASVSAEFAGAAAAGAGLLLHGLEALAAAGAAMPVGHVVVPAEARSALPWLAALGLGIWVVGRRNTAAEAGRRATLLVCGWAWLTLASAARPGGNAAGRLTLHFLDVGQGDGAAIRTPAGRWVLVDAGPRSESYDAGRRVVAPFLARHGARHLAVMVISHAHLDHIGGAEAVLGRIPAAIVLDPAAEVAEPAYTGLLAAVGASDATTWLPARAGLRFVLDSVAFTVLHPDTAWAEWGIDVNEGSAVLRLDYREFSAIFAGDAGFPAETRMRRRAGRTDVLKVGHHGSAGSTGAAWLDELEPSVAVVSVGRNRYGHPAPQALERLQRSGASVWRTDLDGTVSVTTDGVMMTVRGRHRGVTLPVR